VAESPPAGYPRISPYLLYADAEAAIEFLVRAFGFEERRRTAGGAGRLHAELVHGSDGLVMLGQAGEGFRSRSASGSGATALIHVYVDDVEALHERAGAAGADVSELEESPQGDRRFDAEDPEGHWWVFAQRVR